MKTPLEATVSIGKLQRLYLNLGISTQLNDGKISSITCGNTKGSCAVFHADGSVTCTQKEKDAQSA